MTFFLSHNLDSFKSYLLNFYDGPFECYAENFISYERNFISYGQNFICYAFRRSRAASEADFSPIEGQNRAKEGQKRANDTSKASEVHHATGIDGSQSHRDDRIIEKEIVDIVQTSKVFKTLEVYRDEYEMQPPRPADPPPVEGNF